MFALSHTSGNGKNKGGKNMNITDFVSNMLESSGEKLKKFTKILNIVYLVCTVIALLIWLIAGLDICREYHSYSYISGGYFEFNFIKYMGIALLIAVSYGFEYLSCLFLTGISELFINVEKIKNNSESIKQNIQKEIIGG